MITGDYEVTALSDGTATFPMDKLLTNITVPKTETLLARAYLKPQYEVSMNNSLINTGAGLVLEATGRTLAPSPFLSSAVIGASALLLAGDAAQQEAWLPKIVSGEAILALAVDEGAHHSPARVALQATAAGEVFHLSAQVQP